MDKSIYWTLAIKNSICIICWTILAVIFDEWWIALFSAFFISDLKYHIARHYRVCDKCGRHSEYAESSEEALKKAKESGWIHYDGMDKDYCPDCQ